MDCPEFDELSAWHDGESDAASIDAHIDNCADCQAALDSLERMDEALIAPAPSEEVLARIQTGCMRELRKPAPRPAPVLSMQLLTRLAAIFALVGIALFMKSQLKQLEPGDVTADLGQPTSAAMITHTPTPDAPPPPPPAPSTALAESAHLPPPVPEAPVDAIAESATPAPSLLHTPAPVSKPAVSVDFDAIRLVATGSDSRRQLHSRQRGNITAPSQNQVPDVVRHVWLAEDVVAPLKALRDLMAQDNRAQLDELVKGEAESYSLTLSATDRNLQALVNQMHDIGMLLVSPDAPQPQTTPSLQFSDKIVRYQVDFVKK
jgi:hypothetical protein